MINVDWMPNRRADKPIYQQIIEYFKGRIGSGEWPPGTVIPPQRRLAEIFNVNRSTIVSALDELKALGILEGYGKGGTRVISSLSSEFCNIQPNWQSYIDEGIYIPNVKTIKKINKLEFDDAFIRLSTGEASPEFFPNDKMSVVLNEMARDMKNLGYEEPLGTLYLREQVSKYLKTIGINVSPSSILIVSGALQAIQLITIGLLQPGSTVFLEKPSYLYSLPILQSIGMRRCGIPMDAEGIQCSLIKKNIRKNGHSILYTIPNYQNPTGIMMSETRRKELIDVCRDEKLPIIEDDVYRELWIDKRPPNPLKSIDSSGLVLYVGSVSKTLSPGLRIGWIAGPETVIERLGDLKMQTDYGSSSLAQLTVGKWFETGLYYEHVEFLRKQLAHRRNIALACLEKYFKDIAYWEIPSGGYYIWLSLKKPVDMVKLFDEACKIGILMYPGYIYDTNQNSNLRISYSYASESDLIEGITRLSKLLYTLMD